MTTKTTPVYDRRLAERQAQFCGVFSSPIRLQIMLLLGERELTVGEIAEILDYAMPLVSQHLRLMRDKGCLGSRKDGKNVYYFVQNTKFLEAIRLVREGMSERED